MQHAVIVATVRTPIGRAHKGALAGMRPDDLLAHTVAEALARVPGLEPEAVDELIVGCALPGGEQGFNIARIAAVLLGWDRVPGVTVNRFCSSSLQAIRMAAQAVRCGDAAVVVAAGVESQSRLAHGSSDTWPGTENPPSARLGNGPCRVRCREPRRGLIRAARARRLTRTSPSAWPPRTSRTSTASPVRPWTPMPRAPTSSPNKPWTKASI